MSISAMKQANLFEEEVMSISAMKQALEALEEVQRYDKTSEWFDKKVSALRKAIERAEKQEPVAWVHRLIEGGFSFGKKPADLDRHPDRWQPLYADPVPCKTCEALSMSVMADHVYHEQVCPKKEWVGLTDEDIEDAFYFSMAKYIEEVDPDFYSVSSNADYVFARALDAKLKERNNG